MKVDTGCVVGWDGTVGYEIKRVKGIKTMFFGGEDLFLTTLRGPRKMSNRHRKAVISLNPTLLFPSPVPSVSLHKLLLIPLFARVPEA